MMPIPKVRQLVRILAVPPVAVKRGRSNLAVAKCTLGHVMGKGQWLSEAYTMSNYTLYSIGLRPDD
jgi:hypothetical protein